MSVNPFNSVVFSTHNWATCISRSLRCICSCLCDHHVNLLLDNILQNQFQNASCDPVTHGANSTHFLQPANLWCIWGVNETNTSQNIYVRLQGKLTYIHFEYNHCVSSSQTQTNMTRMIVIITLCQWKTIRPSPSWMAGTRCNHSQLNLLASNNGCR
jgi:hypothetical protein